jgi:hypothetical protein
VSVLQQPMEHPNVSVSYFVMHFAMSVSKRLFCTCRCDFMPHLDVFVYKSLWRPCTGLQQLVLHLYKYLFNSSLCCARRGLVYTAACAAPGCTSICICSTAVWVVLGGVWPTAAFANLIDVAVYCAAPVLRFMPDLDVSLSYCFIENLSDCYAL